MKIPVGSSWLCHFFSSPKSKKIRIHQTEEGTTFFSEDAAPPTQLMLKNIGNVSHRADRIVEYPSGLVIKDRRANFKLTPEERAELAHETL